MVGPQHRACSDKVGGKHLTGQMEHQEEAEWCAEVSCQWQEGTGQEAGSKTGFESCLKVSHRAGGQAQWRPGNLAAGARFWVKKKCIQKETLGPISEFLVWPPSQAESATLSSGSSTYQRHSYHHTYFFISVAKPSMAFFGLKHFSGYLKINAKLLTMIDKVLYNPVMDCTPASLVTPR